MNLGIIGGLGPETSSRFCLDLNRKLREKASVQPHLIMDNLPISLEAEQKIINNELTEEHFNLMVDSVQRLNDLDVDMIAIPCNTVHVFIDDLRGLSSKPIISIIEETVQQCKRWKTIGLIASTKTVAAGLFEQGLNKEGIELMLPNEKEQKQISEIILKIITNRAREKEKEFLIKVIDRLNQHGAEAVVLGCTDFPLLIKEGDASIPLLNTLEILENSVVEKFVVKK